MRDRGQVTIPGEIREALELKPGTILEAHTEEGRIVLEIRTIEARPNTPLDDMITESLAQVDRGETVGPFNSIDEWKAHVKTLESEE